MIWTETEAPAGFDVWAYGYEEGYTFLGNFPNVEQAKLNAERYAQSTQETLQCVMIQATARQVWTWNRRASEMRVDQ